MPLAFNKANYQQTMTMIRARVKTFANDPEVLALRQFLYHAGTLQASYAVNPISVIFVLSTSITH